MVVGGGRPKFGRSAPYRATGSSLLVAELATTFVRLEPMMAKPFMEVAVGGMYVEIIYSSTPDSQHESQVVWLTTYSPFLTFTLPPSLGVNLMIFSCSNAALFGHKLEFESSLCGAGGGDFSRTSLAEQFSDA